MIEFGDFFYKDKPLSAQINKPQAKKAPSKKQTPATKALSVVSLADLDEKTIAETLSKLKDKVDPGKIDWSKAGYDFGEGFGGSSKRPR